MQNTPRHIYKILTPDQWDAFCAAGETEGSPLDRADGFLHFSTPAQLAETLAKHFAKAGPLVLAEIPLSALDGQDLRWEPARDGSLFPHLYDILNRDRLSQHWPLHADTHGVYVLPEVIRQT